MLPGYDFRKKSDPTFTQWSGNRKYGKVVIYNALHKGNVNLNVRIADPRRSNDCSTANLFSLITASVDENKCVTKARVPV